MTQNEMYERMRSKYAPMLRAHPNALSALETSLCEAQMNKSLSEELAKRMFEDVVSMHGIEEADLMIPVSPLGYKKAHFNDEIRCTD